MTLESEIKSILSDVLDDAERAFSRADEEELVQRAHDKIMEAIRAHDAMDAADSTIVPLPGSEGWESAWRWGDKIAELFPGRDAHDLASACEYNGWGPLRDHNIVRLDLLQQGEHDGPGWIWQVDLDNGEVWRAEGGCDYTGWDCQSHLTWEKIR